MTILSKLISHRVVSRGAAVRNMAVTEVKVLRARHFRQHRLTGEEQNNHQGGELGDPSHAYCAEYVRPQIMGL